MEFFLHYITADVKYDFWCEEDGHQFREDWVKCRINIKNFDSPNIQISCYPVNHSQIVPLNVNIDFSGFRFERASDLLGEKPNVFALLWTQQGQSSEFCIAIENPVQYKNYEIYLNNLVKICRIAENERSNAQTTIEYPSASFRDFESSTTASTLSLFSVSAYGCERNPTITNDVQAPTEVEKKRFRGISKVKYATKCAAKKLNRILAKAKSKLIKPATEELVNISDSSMSTQFTDVDLYDVHYHEEKYPKMQFNDFSRFSSQSTLVIENFNYGHIPMPNVQPIDDYYAPDDSLDISSRTLETSLHSETSIQSEISLESGASLNDSALIHQIIAESMADLNKICAQNEKTPIQKNEPKRIVRKGTPYKLKMPHRLTLYDSLQYDEDTDKSVITSKGNKCNDSVNSTIDRIFNENEADLWSKCEHESLFGLNTVPKESLFKRIAQKYRHIELMLTTPNFLYAF